MSQGQTQYFQNFGAPYAGQIADGNPRRTSSLLNKTGGAMRAGLAVKFGATAGEAALLAAIGDSLAGVIALEMNTDPDNIAGTANYNEGTEMVVLEAGSISVPVDFAVNVGDPVYVRLTPGTGNINLAGAFGNVPDLAANVGTCRLVSGASWKTSAVAGATALLQIDVLTDQATR